MSGSWRCPHSHTKEEHPACWKRFKEQTKAIQTLEEFT